MSDTATEGDAFYAKPSLRQRALWRLGYRWHHEFFEEELPGCLYWARTNVRIRIGFLDRLRVLVGGRIDLRLEHRSDVQIGKMVTKTSVYFPAPGEGDH